MFCFKQGAKAYYVRQRLFSDFRKWKKTVKKQVKDANRFLKNLLSIQNTAICLSFLAVSTGLWDLMDLIAYCTKKRLIRRRTPFKKAIQHAIRQQLRKIVCWWRVRVEQAIKFKLKLLQNKRRESWAHSNRTQLSVRSCGDSFRNLKSEIQNVLLRNEIRY